MENAPDTAHERRPEPAILVREEFYARHRQRLDALRPPARFLTFRDRGEMLGHAPEAEAAHGAALGDGFLDAAPRLRWVHVRSAGVDRTMAAQLAARGITLTKGSGAFDIPISEHILAMMLAFTRGLPTFLRNQTRHEWDRRLDIVQLAGKALGIYGMGSIGTELGRKAHALGMTVFGIALHERPTPDFAEALWTPDALDDMLPLVDFLAICVPLTDATRGRFGRREFALMRPTAYVFNIGRGGTIVQDDLIEALRTGAIAGAGLDVTSPEPLPTDSPLWDMPNVILTPHVSGHSDGTDQRADEIFIENIRRFAAGEPLRNVVDPHHGY
jgi:phosphoglycerate dehydrogenase-like enzyme